MEVTFKQKSRPVPVTTINGVVLNSPVSGKGRKRGISTDGIDQAVQLALPPPELKVKEERTGH